MGCLLHPSARGGEDRRRASFALLPGCRCGEPGYVCDATTRYRAAPLAERKAFRQRADGLGWFAYSQAVERFGG